MVVNITTTHFHYRVVTIIGSNVHFKSCDIHYSVFTVYLRLKVIKDVIRNLIDGHCVVVIFSTCYVVVVILYCCNKN